MIVLRTADTTKKRFLFVGLIIPIHIGEHLYLIQRTDNDPGVFPIRGTQNTNSMR